MIFEPCFLSKKVRNMLYTRTLLSYFFKKLSRKKMYLELYISSIIFLKATKFIL